MHIATDNVQHDAPGGTGPAIMLVPLLFIFSFHTAYAFAKAPPVRRASKLELSMGSVGSKADVSRDSSRKSASRSSTRALISVCLRHNYGGPLREALLDAVAGACRSAVVSLCVLLMGFFPCAWLRSVNLLSLVRTAAILCSTNLLFAGFFLPACLVAHTREASMCIQCNRQVEQQHDAQAS
jgi:hypothetical protein